MAIVVPSPAPNNVVTTQNYEVVGMGVPFIVANTGTMAANGALTLGTALPTTYANAYVFLPAGAIATGSAAGWYYTQFTSTTVGTVFNNLYVAGTQPVLLPTAALVPFVTTGPGAYTGSTASNIGPSFNINSNMLGGNGGVARLTTMMSVNNTAGAKTLAVTLNAVTVQSNALTTTTGNVAVSLIFNRSQPASLPSGLPNPGGFVQGAAFTAAGGALGNQTPQYSTSLNLNVGAIGGSVGPANVGSTVAGSIGTLNVGPLLNVTLQLATATDVIVLEGFLLEAVYGA